MNNLELHKEMWSRLYEYYKITPPVAWVDLYEAKRAVISVMGVKHKPMFNSFLCAEYRDQFARCYDAYKCGLCPLATRDVNDMCQYKTALNEAIAKKDLPVVLANIAKIRDVVDE